MGWPQLFTISIGHTDVSPKSKNPNMKFDFDFEKEKIISFGRESSAIQTVQLRIEFQNSNFFTSLLADKISATQINAFYFVSLCVGVSQPVSHVKIIQAVLNEYETHWF